MCWYNSLFFKVFLWFWSVIFLAMWSAILTNEWIEEDYFRSAQETEIIHLAALMDFERPIIAEGRKLWRALRPGWNLVAVPVDVISQLPHTLEGLVEQAEEQRQVIFGHSEGMLMIGPMYRDGYLYLAVARQDWNSLLENENRFLVPLAVLFVVTLLCCILVWSLTRPIQVLQSAVRRLAKGDFDVSDLRRVRFRDDELGMLAGEMVDMANSLQRLLNSYQQLLKDVSHELRSPLTRLQIALGIARKKDQHNLLVAEHDRIERAVGQVEGLISQILDLARLQHTDTTHLYLDGAELQEVVRDWLQNAELEIADKELNVALELPAEPILCQWDWVMIERVFDNLLRNAIRYSPAHSTLSIGARVQHEIVEFWVRDEGPGVPVEQLDAIFDPFTQVDSARDHANGGYGLGLALVKRIVELHKGSVSALNCEPGLKLIVRLPQNKHH